MHDLFLPMKGVDQVVHCGALDFLEPIRDSLFRRAYETHVSERRSATSRPDCRDRGGPMSGARFPFEGEVGCARDLPVPGGLRR